MHQKEDTFLILKGKNVAILEGKINFKVCHECLLLNMKRSYPSIIPINKIFVKKKLLHNI